MKDSELVTPGKVPMRSEQAKQCTETVASAAGHRGSWRFVSAIAALAAALVAGAVAFAQDGGDVFASTPGADADGAAVAAPATPPAAPAAAAAAAPQASAAAGASGDVNYDLRLRELEGRVNELKEDIFRTKSRLFLLREQILQEGIGGSRLVAQHRDRLGATYTTVRAQYFLDGNLIWTASEGNEGLRDEARAFSGAVLPGPHSLSVEYVLRGNDFGVFSYMNGYEFTLRSSHTFSVADGQTYELIVEPYERGGANEPLDERPDVRFRGEAFATTEDTVAAEAE